MGTVPDYWLEPQTGLSIEGNPVTMTQPTRLPQMLRPNIGRAIGGLQGGWMTYFADGSPYSFLETNEPGPLVNVGWLSAEHPYASGAIPEELAVKLAGLCRNGVQRTRGFHRCEFCAKPDGLSWTPPISARDDEGEFIVGAAEIRVSDAAGVTFAGPDMIIHYVTDHGYRPPDEFLDALRRSLA